MMHGTAKLVVVSRPGPNQIVSMTQVGFDFAHAEGSRTDQSGNDKTSRTSDLA